MDVRRHLQGWPASADRGDSTRDGERIGGDEVARRCRMTGEKTPPAQAGGGLAGGGAVDDQDSRGAFYRAMAAVTAVGEKTAPEGRTADRWRLRQTPRARGQTAVQAPAMRAEAARPAYKDAARAGHVDWSHDGPSGRTAGSSGGCLASANNACTRPTRNVRCETSSGTATDGNCVPGFCCNRGCTGGFSFGRV